MNRTLPIYVVGTLLVGGLFALAAVRSPTPSKEQPMPLELTSPRFSHRGEIPSAYTCEGANQSPALAWTGAPDKATTYALIVDDPDAPDPRAPQRTFVHWVLYNIPAGATGLPESATEESLPPA